MRWTERNCGTCAFLTDGIWCDRTSVRQLVPGINTGTKANRHRCGEHRSEAEMERECGMLAHKAAAWAECHPYPPRSPWTIPTRQPEPIRGDLICDGSIVARRTTQEATDGTA